MTNLGIGVRQTSRQMLRDKDMEIVAEEERDFDHSEISMAYSDKCLIVRSQETGEESLEPC